MKVQQIHLWVLHLWIQPIMVGNIRGKYCMYQHVQFFLLIIPQATQLCTQHVYHIVVNCMLNMFPSGLFFYSFEDNFTKARLVFSILTRSNLAFSLFYSLCFGFGPKKNHLCLIQKHRTLPHLLLDVFGLLFTWHQLVHWVWDMTTWTEGIHLLQYHTLFF